TVPEFVLFFDCEEEEMEKRLLKEDDNIETIRKRFKVFVESSLPMIEYYNSRGKIRKIDTAKPVDAVFEDVKVVFASLDEKLVIGDESDSSTLRNPGPWWLPATHPHPARENAEVDSYKSGLFAPLSLSFDIPSLAEAILWFLIASREYWPFWHPKLNISLPLLAEVYSLRAYFWKSVTNVAPATAATSIPAPSSSFSIWDYSLDWCLL
ncbi:hypothetical protein Ancab_037279, partial [Ancistrocladus abbreviatus]